MSKKLKELSKITTRYENLNEWNDTSFKSLPKRWSKNVNDTRDGLTELEILYTTGRIEADGITIIYED